MVNLNATPVVLKSPSFVAVADRINGITPPRDDFYRNLIKPLSLALKKCLGMLVFMAYC